MPSKKKSAPKKKKAAASKPGRPAKKAARASRGAEPDVVYTDVRREMRSRLLGRLLGA